VPSGWQVVQTPAWHRPGPSHMVLSDWVEHVSGGGAAGGSTGDAGGGTGRDFGRRRFDLRLRLAAPRSCELKRRPPLSSATPPKTRSKPRRVGAEPSFLVNPSNAVASIVVLPLLPFAVPRHAWPADSILRKPGETSGSPQHVRCVPLHTGACLQWTHRKLATGEGSSLATAAAKRTTGDRLAGTTALKQTSAR
jgi:hypothetical protein